MSDIGVRIIGDRVVALRFDKFPEIARQQLVEVLTDLQRTLQSRIQSIIPKRSGKLAATISGGVESNPQKVRAWVNVGGKDRNVILKAMALEYGSHNAVKVSAKASRGLRTVYGRYVTPMQVAVGSYTRNTDIVAQRFMRGPLAGLADTALPRMEKALDTAIAYSEAQA